MAESTPLNQLPKDLSQVITIAVPNLANIRLRGASGHMGETIEILFINLIYLCPFSGNSPTGQMRRWIFAHDGSNDVDSRKDVP